MKKLLLLFALALAFLVGVPAAPAQLTLKNPTFQGAAQTDLDLGGHTFKNATVDSSVTFGTGWHFDFVNPYLNAPDGAYINIDHGGLTFGKGGIIYFGADTDASLTRGTVLIVATSPHDGWAGGISVGGGVGGGWITSTGGTASNTGGGYFTANGGTIANAYAGSVDVSGGTSYHGGSLNLKDGAGTITRGTGAALSLPATSGTLLHTGLTGSVLLVEGTRDYYVNISAAGLTAPPRGAIVTLVEPTGAENTYNAVMVASDTTATTMHLLTTAIPDSPGVTAVWLLVP